MNEQLPKRIRWDVPEYHKQTRSTSWHITATVAAFLMLFFCFFSFNGWRLIFLGTSSNYLFALIIIIVAIIMIVKESQEPKLIKIELGLEGIKVGEVFFDYDQFKNFSVLYKPKQSIKNLYLEYKNGLLPRLSLPLRHLDALSVRNYLIKYLDEDLERTDPPLSEQLTKLLKL